MPPGAAKVGTVMRSGFCTVFLGIEVTASQVIQHPSFVAAPQAAGLFQGRSPLTSNSEKI